MRRRKEGKDLTRSRIAPIPFQVGAWPAALGVTVRAGEDKKTMMRLPQTQSECGGELEFELQPSEGSNTVRSIYCSSNKQGARQHHPSCLHSPGQGLHPGLEGAVPDDDPREASADVSGRTCNKGGEGNYMRKDANGVSPEMFRSQATGCTTACRSAICIISINFVRRSSNGTCKLLI